MAIDASNGSGGLARDDDRHAADDRVARDRSRPAIRLQLRRRRLRAQVSGRRRHRDHDRRLARAHHVEDRCRERRVGPHDRQCRRHELALRRHRRLHRRRRRLSGPHHDDQSRHRRAGRLQHALQQPRDAFRQRRLLRRPRAASGAAAARRTMPAPDQRITSRPATASTTRAPAASTGATRRSRSRTTAPVPAAACRATAIRRRTSSSSTTRTSISARSRSSSCSRPPAARSPHLGMQTGKDAKLRLINLDNMSGAGAPAHVGGEIQLIERAAGRRRHARAAGDLGRRQRHARGSSSRNGSGLSGLTLGLDGSNVPQLSSVWQNEQLDDIADRRERTFSTASARARAAPASSRAIPRPAMRSGRARTCRARTGRVRSSSTASSTRSTTASKLWAFAPRRRRRSRTPSRRLPARTAASRRHAADRQRRQHDQLHGDARRALPHRRRHRLRRLAQRQHVYDRPDHRRLHGQRDVRDHRRTPSRRAATAATARSRPTRRRPSTTATRRAFTITPDAHYQIEASPAAAARSRATPTRPARSPPTARSPRRSQSSRTRSRRARGSGGSITPDTPQTVDDGATTTFTVAATPPYQVDSVSGCGGSLAGDTYTTGAITGDCTVTATFSILEFVFSNGFDGP